MKLSDFTKSAALAALAVLSAAVPSLAQPPADSLNGKTIHLYVESEDFTAFYFQNGDIPFQADGKYKYTLTMSGFSPYQQDFFLSSNGNTSAGEHFRWKLGKTGLDQARETRFTVADFAGHAEMWIVIDPAGPLTAPPLILFEAPKTINILNPWPASAPRLVLSNGKVRNMSATPDRCGWFTAMLFDSVSTSGHFAEIWNEGVYGKGGTGSSGEYDFEALSAAHGATLWLNTQSNTWAPAYPDVEGSCQYMMAATVRDFSAEHPDFHFGGLSSPAVQKGMVETDLGPDLKPKRSPKASVPPATFGLFNSWWNTDSTNAVPTLRSYETCVDIPMSKADDGLWEYDSFRHSPVDRGFFPAEGTDNRFNETSPSCYSIPPTGGTQFVTGGPRRNFNYCMESHATFIYRKGQVFHFRGDDDLWVFINGKLAVDQGGPHEPIDDSVSLDSLGLVPGQQYKWDLFDCERQPCGSSLRIKTSIYFKQYSALYVQDPIASQPGSLQFEIRKRMGGLGSCASIGDSIAEGGAKPGTMTYQLLDGAGKLVKELGEGTFYGGITIATPLVTVDTSKMDSLPDGPYRVVAHENANAQIKVEIPFRVAKTTSIRSRRRLQSEAASKAERYRDALGRRMLRSFPNRVHSPMLPHKAQSRKSGS